MIRMFFALAIIYLTLYFFGYSLKVLLLNDDLKKFDLYITPWFGVGVITVVLIPLSMMGYSVADVARPFAAAVTAVNLGLWLKFRERPRFTSGDAFLLAFLGILTAVVYGGILSLKGPDYFAASTTADFGVYLNCAKAALLSSAREMSAKPFGIPLISPISYILNNQLRGALYIHALLAALYSADLAEILYPLLAFAFFLSASSFRLFLKRDKTPWAAFPVLAVLILNTFYQKFVFLAFVGQAFSFGLVTVAFYLEFYLSERRRFDPRTCAALVAILTANGLCWLEGMAFPLIPAVALCAALLLNVDYDKKSCVRNMAFAGISWAVLNSWPIILFVKIFMTLDGSEQGWPMPFVTFMDVAGLAGAPLPQPASAVLLVAINVLFVFLLIYQARREKFFSLLSLSLALFFILHAAFCARYYKAGEKLSYNAFKSALSLSFIAVIFALRFLEERLSRVLCLLRRAEAGTRWKSIAAAPGSAAWLAVSAAILLAFLALNLSACWKNMRAILTSSDDVMPSGQHAAIGPFAASSGSAVIINFDAGMTQSVAEYYSPRGAVYTNRVESPGLSGGREGGVFRPGDIYAADPVFEELLQTTDAKPIFENDIYKIFRLDEGSLLLDGCPGMDGKINIEQIGGEYMILRRFLEKNAALRFLSLRPREANLQFTIYGETPEPFSCEIFAGENFAGKRTSQGGFINVTLEGIMMPPGASEIKISLSVDPSEVKISLTSLKIF